MNVVFLLWACFLFPVAHSQAITFDTIVSEAHSNLCVGIRGSSRRNGVYAIQSACSGISSQDFAFRPIAADVGVLEQETYYQIIAKHSGMCLGVRDDSAVGGGKVVQMSCDLGRDSQLWSVQEGPTPERNRIVVKHTGFCMNIEGGSYVQGADIIQWPCVGATNEQWDINALASPETSMSSMPNSGGTFDRIINANGSNKCLNVEYASFDDGAQLIQYTCTNDPAVTNERFAFERASAGSDYFLIRAQHSNKCLGVLGASQIIGADIGQTTCSTTDDSQLWSVRGQGDNQEIVVKHTGMCMNIEGAGDSDNTPIIQYPCTQSPNDTWRIENGLGGLPIATADAPVPPPAGAPSVTTSQASKIPSPGDNIGKVVNVNGSNKCVNVEFGSLENDAPVIQYTCINDLSITNEQFSFERVDNEGRYFIRAQHSLKCLGVLNGSTAATAPVVQKTCDMADNSQIWTVRGQGNSREIIVQHTGMCMNIEGGGPADGTHIVQYPCTQSPNDTWRIEANLEGLPMSSEPSLFEGPYAMPIIPVAVANLVDGRILAWSAYARMSFGYYAGYTWISIFNPADNTSTEQLIENTGHDMFCSGTAVLPDGRVFITGGSDSGVTTFYNPNDNSWLSGPRMNLPRAYHGMTVLPDGSVFTVGGSWNGGIGGRNGEVWDIQNGAWNLKNNISPEFRNLSTDDPRGPYRADNHMWLFTAPNGRVFHAGPSRQTHWIDVAGGGSVTEAALRGATDQMNGNAIMYDVGKILTLGGAPTYDDGISVAVAHTIDLNNGNSVSIQETGPMNFARTLCNSVVLPNGQVVVVGGQAIGTIFTDLTAVFAAELWDPTTDTFSVLDAMANVPRTYHSVALLLQDGRVLVGGGGLCGGCPVNHPNVEILTPPYLLQADGSLAPRPEIVSASASVAPSGRITVSMSSQGDYSFALVRLSAATHSINNDLRRFPLQVLSVSSTGRRFTLQVPDQNVAVPGSYFLFAMDSAGVPSEAKVVLVAPQDDS